MHKTTLLIKQERDRKSAEKSNTSKLKVRMGTIIREKGNSYRIMGPTNQ